MTQETICPHCGEKENFHFNYDYTQKHMPVIDVLCNECGKFFYMNKEEQKKLLTEIMNDDANDGLYDQDISKMETTQTAVEWLASKLSITFQTMYDEEIKQAKQMEKEQIENAYVGGLEGLYMGAEEYYNKTYKK